MASLKDMVEEIKNKISEMELKEANKNIGKTGLLETRPTGDIAYRYNQLKNLGKNTESEEKALDQLLDQENYEYKTKIQFPPDFAGLNSETRKERYELLKELQKRKKTKED